MTTVAPGQHDHPHVDVLRSIYANLICLGEYADPYIVLHRADRTPGDDMPVVGRDAVLAHEQALLDLTRGTLIMRVDHIVANAHFGAVMGTLLASYPTDIAMPFCGLWRFQAGRIVEHWENAHDPVALKTQLLQPAGDQEPGVRVSA